MLWKVMSNTPLDTLPAQSDFSTTSSVAGLTLTHSPGCAFSRPISLSSRHSLIKPSRRRISATARVIAARAAASSTF
jgi:hypothetical protein